MATIIVAYDRNRGIGIENRLPWQLSGDLRWVAKVTTAVQNPGKRNAIVGFDARGEAEMEELRQRLTNDEVFAITGHGINSYHTLFKILWRKRHDPATFARAAKFLCFGDFTMAALGPAPRMDHSIAARTLMFDIHARRWSTRIRRSRCRFR